MATRGEGDVSVDLSTSRNLDAILGNQIAAHGSADGGICTASMVPSTIPPALTSTRPLSTMSPWTRPRAPRNRPALVRSPAPGRWHPEPRTCARALLSWPVSMSTLPLKLAPSAIVRRGARTSPDEARARKQIRAFAGLDVAKHRPGHARALAIAASALTENSPGPSSTGADDCTRPSTCPSMRMLASVLRLPSMIRPELMTVSAKLKRCLSNREG